MFGQLRGCRAQGKRTRRLGFTAVEVVVTLALVAVLAALAISGVRRFLRLSQSAEALHNVGGIRTAVIVRHETPMSEDLAEGAESTTASGPKRGQGKGATVTPGAEGLCAKSIAVPKKMPTGGQKYQPSTAEGEDYHTGSANEGWKCIGFTNNQPQYYQYQYKLGGPPITVKLPHGGYPVGIPAERTFSAWGRGDLDGDGVIAWYMVHGHTKGGQIHTRTAIHTVDPEE